MTLKNLKDERIMGTARVNICGGGNLNPGKLNTRLIQLYFA